MSNNFGCKKLINNSSKYGQIWPNFGPTMGDARPASRRPRAMDPYRMGASRIRSTSALKKFFAIDGNIFVISLKFFQNRPPPYLDE